MCRWCLSVEAGLGPHFGGLGRQCLAFDWALAFGAVALSFIVLHPVYRDIWYKPTHWWTTINAVLIRHGVYLVKPAFKRLESVFER